MAKILALSQSKNLLALVTGSHLYHDHYLDTRGCVMPSWRAASACVQPRAFS